MTTPALINVRRCGGSEVHSLGPDGTTLCGLDSTVMLWLITGERTTCNGCRAAALEMLAVLLAQGADDETSQGVDTSPPCL